MEIFCIVSNCTTVITPYWANGSSSKHSFLVHCAVIIFMCLVLMQIDSPKGLLSDEALGVHAWVWLIEVASAHKDTSQPNPNTVHICVSLSSSGFRQGEWTQLQSSQELREQLWGWTVISFLPVLPVSGFLPFYFLATLLSSKTTWSK